MLTEEQMAQMRGGIEPMSGVDRAWLEMDDPCNPMVVSAVLELSGVHDVQATVRHILARLLEYRRFRQYVDRDFNPPIWCDAGDLLLSYHVRIFHLTEDAPEHDISRAVAQEVARALDPQLPLWQLTLFMRDEGHLTVLFRAHHAIADGMALLGVLMKCTDGAAQEAPPRRAPMPAPVRLLAQLGSAMNAAYDIGRSLPAPPRWPQWMAQRISEGREAVLAVGRVLALPEDNPDCLRRPLQGSRGVAWSGALPFAPIKARAAKLGVKINDLFLAALAGAVRRYLHETQGAEHPPQNLRISIPVNLRKRADGELGNCFGLVLLDLPIGRERWQERVQVVAARMAWLKRSPEARAMLLGLAAAGRLPVAMEKGLVGYLAGKSAAVVSNLPGPQEALTIGGAKLENLVFWPPQTAGIGVGISLFSYNGRVTVGVSADTALIASPAALVALFEDELALILQPRKHAQSQREFGTAAPIRTDSSRAPPPASDPVPERAPAYRAQARRG